MAAMRRTARPLLALLAAAAITATVACGGDEDEGGLPDPDGTEAPVAYRVLYEVTTPDGRGREELVVRRPFGASITERDQAGDVVTQRLSALGLLVTVRDGTATAVETAIAPAAGDLRLDRTADRLVAAGRLEAGEDGQVGGRPCRRFVEPDAVATEGSPEGTGSGGDDERGSFPVRITRCVDAVGIVLEERVATPGGQAVRTKRAVELEVGDDVPDIDVPDVAPLPSEQGGGSVEELTGAPPAVVSWRLRPPEGFRAVGSFIVEPSRLGSDGAAAGAVALVTEVWQRGSDLLLFDQGRTTGGVTLFDPETEVESLDLPGIGAATLAVELRLAEVRVPGADGAFLRVAGTLPVEDLVAVAETLQPAT
jgi:hypothetical protein